MSGVDTPLTVMTTRAPAALTIFSSSREVSETLVIYISVDEFLVELCKMSRTTRSKKRTSKFSPRSKSLGQGHHEVEISVRGKRCSGSPAWAS